MRSRGGEKAATNWQGALLLEVDAETDSAQLNEHVLK